MVTGLDRLTLLSAVSLLVATVVAWIGLARLPMFMSLTGFLFAWTLMMTAMMLPSIAPLVLLYRGSRIALAASYLVVWGVLGLLP